MARDELAATIMISLLVVMRMTSSEESSMPDDAEAAGPSRDDLPEDQPSWDDLHLESDEFNFDLAPRIPGVFPETTVSPTTTEDSSGAERTTTTDEISTTPASTAVKAFVAPVAAVLTDGSSTTLSHTSSDALFPMRKSPTEVTKKSSGIDSDEGPADFAETDEDSTTGTSMSTTQVTGDGSTILTSVGSTVETDSSSSTVTDKIPTVTMTSSSTEVTGDDSTIVKSVGTTAETDNSSFIVTDKIPTVMMTSSSTEVTSDGTTIVTSEGSTVETDSNSSIVTDKNPTIMMTSSSTDVKDDSLTTVLGTAGLNNVSSVLMTDKTTVVTDKNVKFLVDTTVSSGTLQTTTISLTGTGTAAMEDEKPDHLDTSDDHMIFSTTEGTAEHVITAATEDDQTAKPTTRVISEASGLTTGFALSSTVTLPEAQGDTGGTESPVTQHKTIWLLALRQWLRKLVGYHGETQPDATTEVVTHSYRMELADSAIGITGSLSDTGTLSTDVTTESYSGNTEITAIHAMNFDDTQTTKHLDETSTEVSVTQKSEFYSTVSGGTTPPGNQTENILGDVWKSTQSGLTEASTPLISSSSQAADTGFQTSVTRDEESSLETDATTLALTMEDRTQTRTDSQLDTSQETPYKYSTTFTSDLTNVPSTFGTQTTDQSTTVHADTSSLHPAISLTEAGYKDHSAMESTLSYARIFTFPPDSSTDVSNSTGGDTYSPDDITITENVTDHVTFEDTILSSTIDPSQKTMAPVFEGTHTESATEDAFLHLQTEDGTRFLTTTDKTVAYSASTITSASLSTAHTTEITGTFSTEQLPNATAKFTEKDATDLRTHEERDSTLTSGKLTEETTHKDLHFSTLPASPSTSYVHSFGDTEPRTGHTPPYSEPYPSPDLSAVTMSLTVTTPKPYSGKEADTSDTEEYPGTTPEEVERKTSATDIERTDTTRYQPHNGTTQKEQHSSTTKEYYSDTSRGIPDTITVSEIYYTSSTPEDTYGLAGVSSSSVSDRPETAVPRTTQGSPTIHDRTTATGSDVEKTPTTERPLLEKTSFRSTTPPYVSFGETETTEDYVRPEKSHCPEDYPDGTVTTTTMETTNLTNDDMASAVTVVLRLSAPQMAVPEIRQILRRAFQAAILFAVNNSDIFRTEILTKGSDQPTTSPLSLVYLNTSKHEIRELLILTFLIVQQDTDADPSPLGSQTVLKIIEHSRVDLQEMLCLNLSSWFAGTSFWTVDVEDDVRSDDRGYFGLRRIMGKYEALFLVLTVSACSCLLVLVLGLIWTRYRRKANSKYQVDQDKLEARRKEHRRSRELTGCDLRPACEILREEKPYPPPEDDCWVVPLGQVSYNQDDIPPYLNDTTL